MASATATTDTTGGGRQSRFDELVARDTAKRRERAERGASAHNR